MNKEENRYINMLDSLYWLKICFELRKEMRILEEEKRTDLYVFIMSLILSEEVKIWKDLERDLKDEQ